MAKKPTASSIAIVDGSDKEVGFHIPLTSEEFGSFIAGLLKSPRELRFFRSGRFKIEMEDILDIHSLIYGRLSEQHRTTLAAFTAQIWYSDDTILIYRNFDDLKSHGEVGKKECEAFGISWVYLVDLPGSEVPQKQSIELLYSVKASHRSIDKKNGWIMRRARDQDSYENEGMRFSISHTHVSLGYDLSNLLKGRMIRNIIEDNQSSLLTIFRALVSYGLSLSLFGLAAYWISRAAKQYYPIIDEGSLLDIIEAIRVSNGAFALILLLFFIFLGVGGLLFGLLQSSGPSFISLGEHQKKTADEIITAEGKSLRRNLFSATLALVVSVGVNLMSNGIWEYFTK